MRRFTLILVTASLLGSVGVAASADIEVMTQNQYLGADLIGLVTEPDFNEAVISALRTRAESLPAERAKALAALIDKRGPALVGLQEVYKFTCVERDPIVDSKGCQDQSIAGAFTDQLEDTLAALGGRYTAAAIVVNLNLPAGLPELNTLPGIPITVGDTLIFVGVVDRDVILARSDVDYDVIDFTPLQSIGLCLLPSKDGCNYQAAASAELEIPSPIPGQDPVKVDIRFERGFVGVDATVGGKPYRFVTTHLETRLETFGRFPPYARFYQSAQAQELTATLLALQEDDKPTDRTVVVVGDFNSDPRDEVLPVPGFLQPVLGTDKIVPPYMRFVDAGFTDTWMLRPGAGKGKGAPLVGFVLPDRGPVEPQLRVVRADRHDFLAAGSEESEGGPAPR